MEIQQALMCFFAGFLLFYFLLDKEEKIEDEVREEITEIGEEEDIRDVVFLNMNKKMRVKECRKYGDKYICMCGSNVYEIKGGWVVDDMLIVNDVSIEYKDKGIYSVNCAYSVVEQIGKEKIERKKWDLLLAKMKKIAKIEEKDYKEKRIEM